MFSNTHLFVISSIPENSANVRGNKAEAGILRERKKRNRPGYRAPRVDPREADAGDDSLSRATFSRCFCFNEIERPGVNETRGLIFCSRFLRQNVCVWLLG